MKPIHKTFLLTILALVTAFSLCAFVGCENGETDAGYTVAFETGGGTAYKAVTTESKNQKIVLPEPEKQGCTFDGWFADREHTGDKLSGEYLPLSDITLYAKWKENRFTVSFETFGGTAYENVVTDGTKIILPVPERSDGVFVGWYSTENYSGEKLDETFVAVSDATLYAKYDLYKTVAFETFGGENISSAVDRGEGVELPAAFKYGYAFDGWFENEDLSGEKLGDTYSALSDVTLYAKYHEIKYLYIYYAKTGIFDRFEIEPDEMIVVGDYLRETVSFGGEEFNVLDVAYDDIMGKDGEVQQVITMKEDVYLEASLVKLDESADGKYTVTEGSWQVDEIDGKTYYTATSGLSALMFTENTFDGGRISFDVKFVKENYPSGRQAAVTGIVYGSSSPYDVAFSGGTYYSSGRYLFINNGHPYRGDLLSFRRENGAQTSETNGRVNNVFSDLTKTYAISIYWDKQEGSVRYFVDGKLISTCVFNVKLDGSYFGFYSNVSGAVFSNLKVGGSEEEEKGYRITQGDWTVTETDGVMTYTSGSDTSKANPAVLMFTDKSLSGGKISFDFRYTSREIQNNTPATGIIYGASSDWSSATSGEFYVTGMFQAFNQATRRDLLSWYFNNGQKTAEQSGRTNGALSQVDTVYHVTLIWTKDEETNANTVEYYVNDKYIAACTFVNQVNGDRLGLISYLPGTEFSNVTIEEIL